MKKKLVIIVIIVIASAMIGYLLLTYWNNLAYFSKTKHETERWSVIVDTKKDIIAIETTDPDIWVSLKNLNENQTEMWIGGIVEEYHNHWGFRFRPDTIVIAEITIEGAQSNIQGISGDLNYWINVWTKQAYVLAKVVEIHE